ncbi:hypothetical protein [Jiella sonneratiae]|uniref:Uncharacterized protein n=1 Tax=Jiella sonneratiae TaxID=2816856 RepID=A0ABS3J9Y6_9HYPH|nr:hypothetical protein [Jiella sonneratiae]MBO0906492.1 hypothetical protein [Jiella sonneratiae]
MTTARGSKAAAIGAVLLLAAAPGASAQSSALGAGTGAAAAVGINAGVGEGAPGRYQIVTIDGAVARLDTATGAVATCRVESRLVACGDASPGPAATGGEMRLRDLERRVSALEAELARGGSALTGSDETDMAIERMQKLFRGFADIVKELEDDRDSDRNAKGGSDGRAPDRT